MAHFPNNERGVRSINGPGSGTFGESPASGPAPTTAGHHKHDILNKLDPRVDSTQDRRPMAAVAGGGVGAGGMGGAGMGMGMGMGGNNNNGVPEGTYGPHRSRVANTLDPRVDSDMDRHQSGVGGAGAGAAGGYSSTARHVPPTAPAAGMNNNIPEGTYGPHHSRVANALDPRVDSDRDRASGMGAGMGTGMHQHQPQGATYGGGSAAYGAGAGVQQPPLAMSGPGPAPNTAGPHRSDLLNKLDPRVDSKAGTGLAGSGAQAGRTTERHGYESKRGI